MNNISQAVFFRVLGKHHDYELAPAVQDAVLAAGAESHFAQLCENHVCQKVEETDKRLC